MIGDILEKESNNMRINTFSAIQTVKYKFLSQNTTPIISFFKKKDCLHDTVNKKNCLNMENS